MISNLVAEVKIDEKIFRPVGKFPNETALGPVVGDLYNIAIFLGFTAAFILVLWGGIKLITAGGDPKAVESGRKTITFAIVGLIIMIVAYFIVWIVQRLTGVGVLQS